MESILWTQEEGFFLLDYHFRRMQRAAAYFAFPLSINSVLSKLELMQKEFIEIKYKIRVMVNSKGIVNCEYNALLEQTVNDSCLTKIASEPVNIEKHLLYIIRQQTARNMINLNENILNIMMLFYGMIKVK